MTKQRKEKLLELLKQSSVAINGQALAEHFHVTRQIRADGAPILSTNRGYLYKGTDDIPTFHRLFKIKHGVEDMETELLAIVDNGGRVQNILIEHPVYGEIQTYLKLTCRRDVQHFLQQVEGSQFRPLSELTDGVHYHLIQADSQQDLDYVETALRDLGFLLE